MNEKNKNDKKKQILTILIIINVSILGFSSLLPVIVTKESHSYKTGHSGEIVKIYLNFTSHFGFWTRTYDIVDIENVYDLEFEISENPIVVHPFSKKSVIFKIRIPTDAIDGEEYYVNVGLENNYIGGYSYVLHSLIVKVDNSVPSHELDSSSSGTEMRLGIADGYPSPFLAAFLIIAIVCAIILYKKQISRIIKRK